MSLFQNTWGAVPVPRPAGPAPQAPPRRPRPAGPAPQAPPRRPRPWWAVALLPAGGSRTPSAFAPLPTLPSLLAPLFSCAVSALSSEHVVLVGLHVSEHAGTRLLSRLWARVLPSGPGRVLQAPEKRAVSMVCT